MKALVIFCYGTLTSIDDVKAFYKHLLREHATYDYIEKATQMYQSYGMCDPLGAYTQRIGKALAKGLERTYGDCWNVYIANKHTPPFINDVVKQCVKDGAEQIVTLSLSPLSSKSGSELYEIQMAKALQKEQFPIEQLIHISDLYKHPAIIDVLAERLAEAIAWLPAGVQEQAAVVFTAHSMPGTEKTNAKYVQQYTHLAAKLMERMPLSRYAISYRSLGPSTQKWLGKDVLEVTTDSVQNGASAIIACELLSLVENLEVIQEIGCIARIHANELNVPFVQTRYTNDSVDFVTALLTCIEEQLFSSNVIQMTTQK